MNVFFVSSEVAPFAKTGGLADVSAALPLVLHEAGCRVSIVTPYYRETRLNAFPVRPLAACSVSVGTLRFHVRVLESRLHDTLPVYFLQCDELFDRDGLYGESGTVFGDNHVRFICFCRAVLGMCNVLGMQPDIMHLNDWQTALLAPLLKGIGSADPLLHRTASVLTIHNIAFQGVFPAFAFALTGLPERFWHPGQLEFWDQVNFLKGGTVNADMVNTVSPTYAREITTPEFGYGLEGVLAERAADLHGILNGVDYDVWNPARDTLISACYGRDTAVAGKRRCKQDLIARFGLDESLVDRPLVGCISRLADQKGFDLISGCLEELMSEDIGLVVLGMGEQRYHDFFEGAAGQYPGRAGVLLAYDDAAAHMIEAGCDLFLMPSRYEPCGLTQIYSLKYGTVPVVRATGGLADTITDCDRDPGRGNGFTFTEYTAGALLDALRRALVCYRQPDRWRKLLSTCMGYDFSWQRSAGDYLRLYQQARDKKRGIGCGGSQKPDSRIR